MQFAILLVCDEWGDKSQLTAIALAANYGLWSIILGGIVAHVVCIILALLVGTLIKTICSEKMLNISGGLLFIGFAVWMLLE